MTAHPTAVAPGNARQAPQRGSVCAVLVTYHPDAGLAGRIGVVLEQVDRLFVVDNGSGPLAHRLLEEIGARPGVELLRNPENIGLAAALNQGIRAGIGRGYAWGLLLDQDSEIEPGLLATMAAVFEDQPPGAARVAVIGSNYLEGPQGEPWLPPRPGSRWLAVPTVITSGSLVALAICDEVGMMREELFIDYVDHDFCLRAQARGYRVVVTRQPVMRHSIGAVSRHELAGRTLGASNHSALRRYYQSRNRIVVYREYGLRQPRWMARDFYLAAKIMIQLCLFEGQRPAKLRGILLGAWDGLLGRLGKNRRSGLSVSA